LEVNDYKVRFAICKETSVHFLTSPILSHSPPPTTSRSDGPTTAQKSTHQ
jgi:hypothetical protein